MCARIAGMGALGRTIRQLRIVEPFGIAEQLRLTMGAECGRIGMSRVTIGVCLPTEAR
jgi:hypothetical protein